MEAIQDRESLNILSPKLVGPVQLNGQAVLLVGVENEAEFTMKPWFKLAQAAGIPLGESLMEVRDLDLPGDGLILGSRVAAQFALTAGERAYLNGHAIILLEALLISLAAGLIGFFIGTLLAGALGPFLSQTPVPVVWDFGLLGPSVLLSICLGTVASLYPALKAARLDPVDSIRHI